MDSRQIAKDIVELVGGTSNIAALTHCMTRLRFTLKDESIADKEGLEAIREVLGVAIANGQYMVILGKNLLPVYDAVVKEFHLHTTEAVDENLDEPKKEKQPLTPKRIGNLVFGYIIAALSPCLVGIIAGGMLKVALLIATMLLADFGGTSTYTFLSTIADAAFYYMPVFVAYGAATKLGATPIYSMLVMGSLLHPNFVSMVSAGEAVTFFGVNVRLMGYGSSLLPALLITLVAYYAEKGFNKIVPGIFKSILVGLGTIAVTGFFGFTLFGPLGNFLGDYLAKGYMFLGDTIGPFALLLLGLCMPWLVMCGMHLALGTFMAQALVNPGYDALVRPALLMHNMAEGGACLGVALRTKNKAFRSEALGIAVGCIVAGVTEPALYGINLRLKKPMYGVMAGAASGGFIASLLGARAFVMGYSNIIALPIFGETIMAAIAGVVTAIVVAAAVTFVLGFEDEPADAGL